MPAIDRDCPKCRGRLERGFIELYAGEATE